MRIRTGYSFRYAVGHLPEVLDRLKAINDHGCAPISDRASTYAFAKWSKLTKAAGLRPIYGVELGVSPLATDKKPAMDYWTFFAIDDLRPLHKLIALATHTKGYEPSLSYKEAMGAQNVIKITGERVQLDHIKPMKNLFLPLSPSLPKSLFAVAKAKGFSFIATSDNVFTNKDDKEFYRVTLGKRSGNQTYPQYILDKDEWWSSIWYATDKDKTAAARNLETSLKACKAELQQATMLKPKKKKTLRQMCIDGAKKMNVNLSLPIYKDRLEHELNMIDEKKFEDYFYIIADMVSFAKTKMIVGPARGSSCGSLVCYLLNITAVDPIPYGLLFERFIDTTRSDLPDIDIDFSDQNRHIVFEYAEKIYGKERVARLGTVTTYKAKSALKAAAAALKIPSWQSEKVADVMIERTSGDARANEALADTFKSTDAGKKLLTDFPEIVIAERMEGHPSNAGQHAAGIVITEKPVSEYCAIDNRTNSVMCDKRDAEIFNLLKIDALGLSQLSVFERTLELIGEKPVSGWLEKIPLNDQKAFDILNKGYFAGVFQFNGLSVQSIAKELTLTNLEEIVAITALGRPGPMGSGGMHKWRLRKHGDEPVTYDHPLVKPYLEDTLGIITYQEQVMKIGRDIGGLSWADVTALRKAMSKSMGEEYFAQFGERWKTGAIKKGMPKEIADKFWNDLCTFGNWGFNKSHAVAYGIVSYWCCWLKAYHPVEFAAATLDAETEPARQLTLLRELQQEGIDYVPVDIEHSTDRWMPVKKGTKRILVGPLTAIKGIGPSTVAEILDHRKKNEKRKKKEPLRDGLLKRLQEARTEINELYPIKKAVSLFDLETLNIRSKIWDIKDVQCGVDGEVLIIGVINKLAPKDENEAVNVKRRGGKVFKGPHLALNMFIRDDTDQIFAKINRFDYEEMAKGILERGDVGKAVYAIKGPVPPRFRMIDVKRIKYLGNTDINFRAMQKGGQYTRPDEADNAGTPVPEKQK